MLEANIADRINKPGAKLMRKVTPNNFFIHSESVFKPMITLAAAVMAQTKKAESQKNLEPYQGISLK